MPTSSPRVKICGLTTRDAVDAACASGASFIGFVFVHASARNISPANAAGLATTLPPETRSVAVCVNPDDAFLDELLAVFRPDLLQLHGDETPQRVREIATRTGIPIIKALRIASKHDLAIADAYADCAQMLLLDARLPDSTEMGGTGHAFDWQLLEDFSPQLPWFLSGGLNQGNVAEALRITGASLLDVSSGVESSKGIKDLSKIISFMETIHSQG